MRLIDYPVLVVAWGMDGCGACHEYLPRFAKVARKWQRCVPSVAVDVDAFREAADMYRINATPTTIILRYGRAAMRRIEGSAPNQAIEELFHSAAVGMDCQVR